jgi:hypothetical protein
MKYNFIFKSSANLLCGCSHRCDQTSQNPRKPLCQRERKVLSTIQTHKKQKTKKQKKTATITAKIHAIHVLFHAY